MAGDARKRADLAFHELPIGTDLGSIEYELSERLVDRHLRATHQTPYPASGDERYAPVSILASDGIRLAEERFDIGESVHAGQRLEIVNLPIVGTRVKVAGRVVDKFEKGGRFFVVMDLTSTDDRGRLLANGRMTGVARYRPEGSE
ncbi:MAG TPA: hypothetical protein VLS25_06135 [Dehalococcoidia bacterium]|nr:hypothetical protein [Dehalococcoidia bacterium]